MIKLQLRQGRYVLLLVMLICRSLSAGLDGLWFSRSGGNQSEWWFTELCGPYWKEPNHVPQLSCTLTIINQWKSVVKDRIQFLKHAFFSPKCRTYCLLITCLTRKAWVIAPWVWKRDSSQGHFNMWLGGALDGAANTVMRAANAKNTQSGVTWHPGGTMPGPDRWSCRAGCVCWSWGAAAVGGWLWNEMPSIQWAA